MNITDRVHFWQEELEPLGLGHWRVDAVNVVDETPGGSEAKATVQVSHFYDSCTFWFTNSFLDEANDDDLNETIIHEWLHVAMRDFDAAIEEAEEQFGTEACSQWTARVRHAREGFVERLARQIYEAGTLQSDEEISD